ncbi:MAG: CRISPR-associated endoribonuclease Cas6 [Ignavibacteriales bacterium]|nr:CRISPR-associated endoribonuclease Cas6 [Ignavibacteriales bacterium]
MRLYFNLTPNIEPVPFEYQHFLIGAFHKWLGPNDIHDDISLYSLSWLSGGKKEKDMLNFHQGAKWFISCWNEELARKVMRGLLSEPNVCCDMRITDVQMVDTPKFGERQRFLAATPVLVKKYDGQGIKHLLFSDSGVDDVLTATLKTKLEKAGIDNKGLRLFFDRTYEKSKTRLVTIKGIQNRASVCPVIIEGTPEAVAFAWEVGVGHSTGSGFGALC